jgi:hypothetical protein
MMDNVQFYISSIRKKDVASLIKFGQTCNIFVWVDLLPPGGNAPPMAAVG